MRQTPNAFSPAIVRCSPQMQFPQVWSCHVLPSTSRLPVVAMSLSASTGLCVNFAVTISSITLKRCRPQLAIGVAQRPICWASAGSDVARIAVTASASVVRAAM